MSHQRQKRSLVSSLVSCHTFLCRPCMVFTAHWLFWHIVQRIAWCWHTLSKYSCDNWILGDWQIRELKKYWNALSQKDERIFGFFANVFLFKCWFIPTYNIRPTLPIYCIYRLDSLRRRFGYNVIVSALSRHSVTVMHEHVWDGRIFK